MSGWVADTYDGAPLGNVKVYIDGTVAGAATTGYARSDVAAYFNNQAYLDSGCEFIYPAASLTAGSHAVTVIAIDSHGLSTTFGPLSIRIQQSERVSKKRGR